MNKKEAIEEINKTQDEYVDQLVDIISKTSDGNKFKDLKEINFTSPTGTGKTVMIAKLINKLPEYFYAVTTLSKGQLRYQIERNLKKYVKYDNFIVFGLNEYTKNTINQADDFIKMLPNDRRIIWIRDEGHIATNRWQEILNKRSSLIINFSATNKTANGIQCNFTHTMMLRTVSQDVGTPEDAILKLLEVKEAHKNVLGYNPCALFRILHDELLDDVFSLCEKYNLKYINITDESFDMSDICKDNNEYDIIINKFKITEGIDLRRCHVIYMDTKPADEATIIQVIGRARRNALLWNDKIDILAPKNIHLLNETRKSYIFYNVKESELNQTSDGEFSYTLCDKISIECLKPNSRIYVKNGQLLNGLYVLELEGRTGYFNIIKDKDTGFNVVNNDSFYKQKIIESEELSIDLSNMNLNIKKIYFKPSIIDYIQEKVYKRGLNNCPYKITYLLYEKYLESTNREFPKEHYRKIFFIGDKSRTLEDNEALEALKEFRSKYNIYKASYEYWYFLNREISKSFDYNDYTVYSSKRNTKLIGRVNVFETKNIYETNIAHDIMPHVEAIEMIDLYPYLKIQDLIDHNNEIKCINIDKYMVSEGYDLKRKFLNLGIDTVEGIKTKLSTIKSSLFYKPKTERKNIVSNLKCFDDLDNYHIESINLATLNEKYKLKLSNNSIKNMLNNKSELKVGVTPRCLKVGSYNKETRFYSSDKRISQYIYLKDFDLRYKPYSKIFNDREIAIVGTDLMQYVDRKYIESKSVTQKLGPYCKFNRFITKQYENEIQYSEQFLFSGTNKFSFDKKCNSCLGYCVEYYAKYLLYGSEYYDEFIKESMKELKTNEVNNNVIVRACLNAYKSMMKRCFGAKISSLIKTLSVEDLVKNKYEDFVTTVSKLGEKAANFIESKMSLNREFKRTGYLYDPALTINHINGLADFINEDTILDLKCKNKISVSDIKQVLAYHYLSTKRSDLNIKRVIVYDVVSGKYVEIMITDKNLKKEESFNN